jgi:hypothetical protein
MAVLGGAVAAFVTVLWGGGLLRWWDPVFEVDGFESASVDRFWLEIRGIDPHFDRIKTPRHLDELGPLRHFIVEDGAS